MGGRREARLASGRSVRGSSPPSSIPDSSSDEGVCVRRAGGSLSPGAMVRVGGGGSLLLPRGLRSEAKSVGIAMFMPWRAGREGGTSGISSGVRRREGIGGGLLGVGVELVEELWLFSFPTRRGGGGGGTVRFARGGLSGREMLATLSLELSERPREWVLRRVNAGGSEVSDSSSEKGLCLEEVEL